MAKYLLRTEEVYRVDSESEAQELIEEAKQLPAFEENVIAACSSVNLLYILVQSVLIILVELQFVNDLHGLISPVPKGTPLPLILLGKVRL